jgi:hypothetical protein
MSHDDFGIEPVRGLPEQLPDAMALAREALNLRWVAGYFGVLALWRLGALADQGAGPALAGAVPFVLMGVVVCALLWLVAYIQARATVYTITTSRVAMRIGAALTLTLNLPFRQIDSAGLQLRRDGTGTVALDMTGDTRLSYLVCWPHVRPWRMRRVQPALRAIPDAERVAAILSRAVEAWHATPRVARAPTSLAAE